MIGLLQIVPIIAAASYLIALGIAAVSHPAKVTTFMGEFAGTLRAHLIELSIRILVGVSLLTAAPAMQMPGAFHVLGLVLVGSSLLLLVLPWRWHRRFAQWSVPQATANLPLLGVASVAGGLFILWALWGGGV